MDVQVKLEIAHGSANAVRLERALRAAGFAPDSARVWRWRDERSPAMVVKAEFLADLDDVPNQTMVSFDACDNLGAVNLRGSGFAARDWDIRQLATLSGPGGAPLSLRVAGLAGYLLAKVHAAYGRRARKDFYDIAYVLIHNDLGGPVTAARRVTERFAADLVGQTRTALIELAANFAEPDAQGPQAYAEIMAGVHPALDGDVLANDAVAAVDSFTGLLDLR